MLQMLVQHLQLLYHNHQQQVDMENYMNYMLLNPPRRINRRATRQPCSGGSYSLLLVYFVAEVQRHLQARHMYYSVSSGSSGLVWTDTFIEFIEDLFDIEFCSFSFPAKWGLIKSIVSRTV